MLRILSSFIKIFLICCFLTLTTEVVGQIDEEMHQAFIAKGDLLDVEEFQYRLSRPERLSDTLGQKVVQGMGESFARDYQEGEAYVEGTLKGALPNPLSDPRMGEKVKLYATGKVAGWLGEGIEGFNTWRKSSEGAMLTPDHIGLVLDGGEWLTTKFSSRLGAVSQDAILWSTGNPRLAQDVGDIAPVVVDFKNVGGVGLADTPMQNAMRNTVVSISGSIKRGEHDIEALKSFDFENYNLTLQGTTDKFDISQEQVKELSDDLIFEKEVKIDF